ncbi:MAG: family 43 glycosylhydrolase [Pseudobacter sp.]|uniref:family 43 glycosylhydrolase n=1 Tax=Pseudobacter sp. TaxID=2045420 RepID=UPI003F7F0C00
MKKFFFYSLLQLICIQFTRAQQNVIPGEFPDPSIVEVNGAYYACGSSNDWGPVFPVYRSTDLRHWAFLSYVFNEAPAWTINSYWAPELYYHNGQFYCYYTARRKDGISCIGVATTKNIEQGFQDKGVLVEWGNEAIDAFVYKENEKLFITWKAYGLTQGRPIEVLGSELSADGLSLKGEAFTILTAEKNSWEAGGIEGQCVIKNNGYLYMLYSGNGCCGGGCNYQVGVARAKTMKGPWEKYSGNPLLQSNDDWKCPGHGTALKTKNTWAYLYHAYPAPGFPYLGRTALMSEMEWNKNGWPSFKPVPAEKRQGILMGNIQDSFSADKLAPWWRYDVASYNFKASIKEGELHLTEEKRNEKNKTGTALCVNPSVADFNISTKVTGRNQALKGLVLYGTNANSVGIGVKQDTIIVWSVKNGEYTEMNRAVIQNASVVYLKAMVTGARNMIFFYSTDNRTWVPVSGNKNDTSPVNADHLGWWSWGIKAGLFVKTDPVTGDNNAVFDEFNLLNYSSPSSNPDPKKKAGLLPANRP